MNETLSERELSVVRLLAEGRTNKEIGEELGITTSTVKAHLVRIGLKLRVHKRAQVAIWAVKKRLLVKHKEQTELS